MSDYKQAIAGYRILRLKQAVAAPGNMNGVNLPPSVAGSSDGSDNPLVRDTSGQEEEAQKLQEQTAQLEEQKRLHEEFKNQQDTEAQIQQQAHQNQLALEEAERAKSVAETQRTIAENKALKAESALEASNTDNKPTSAPYASMQGQAEVMGKTVAKTLNKSSSYKSLPHFTNNILEGYLQKEAESKASPRRKTPPDYTQMVRKHSRDPSVDWIGALSRGFKDSYKRNAPWVRNNNNNYVDPGNPSYTDNGDRTVDTFNIPTNPNLAEKALSPLWAHGRPLSGWLREGAADIVEGAYNLIKNDPMINGYRARGEYHPIHNPHASGPLDVFRSAVESKYTRPIKQFEETGQGVGQLLGGLSSLGTGAFMSGYAPVRLLNAGLLTPAVSKLNSGIISPATASVKNFIGSKVPDSVSRAYNSMAGSLSNLGSGISDTASNIKDKLLFWRKNNPTPTNTTNPSQGYRYTIPAKNVDISHNRPLTSGGQVAAAREARNRTIPGTLGAQSRSRPKSLTSISEPGGSPALAYLTQASPGMRRDILAGQGWGRLFNPNNLKALPSLGLYGATSPRFWALPTWNMAQQMKSLKNPEHTPRLIDPGADVRDLTNVENYPNWAQEVFQAFTPDTEKTRENNWLNTMGPTINSTLPGAQAQKDYLHRENNLPLEPLTQEEKDRIAKEVIGMQLQLNPNFWTPAGRDSVIDQIYKGSTNPKPDKWYNNLYKRLKLNDYHAGRRGTEDTSIMNSSKIPEMRKAVQLKHGVPGGGTRTVKMPSDKTMQKMYDRTQEIDSGYYEPYLPSSVSNLYESHYGE